MKRLVKWVVVGLITLVVLLAHQPCWAQTTSCTRFYLYAAPWNAGTAYRACSIVSDHGSSYVALVATINSEPPSSKWQLLSGKGTDGTNGAAATIAIGTVTTLPPNSAATVFNAGTQQQAMFNFGIPQGSPGSPGPPIAGLSGDGQGNINVAGKLTANGIFSTAPGTGTLQLVDAAGKQYNCTLVASSPISPPTLLCKAAVTP